MSGGEAHAGEMRRSGVRGPVSSAGLVLTLGLFAACSSGSNDPDPDPSADTPISSAAGSDDVPEGDDTAVLDGIIDLWRTTTPDHAGEVPGVILLVSQGGRTRGLAVGSAQLEPEKPMRVDHRFGVGSVTKMMVAVTILQLEEEGTLELDDTVEKWLPGMLDFGAKVTIEDLLDHRSGIWDVVNHTDFDVGTDLTDRRLRQLLDHPPTGPPDTASRYTNPGYWLLGKIIERATGRPLATELRNRVFAPAGMTDAVLSTDLDDEADLVRGYDANNRDITLGDYTGAWAAGGVVATAADIARFLDALVHGDLVSDATFDDMITSRGQLPAGWGYGLGVVRADSRCGALLGHGGSIDGYNTLAFHNPGLDRTVVGFTNTTSDAGTEAVTRHALDAICYTSP